ncbi:unnamed protein product (mitochondrion) [Plasmodiophora brassicae]|uniref:Uncharacterized protein n=1 Tax=Plasmodiophora brassicae TaxID=37360 RepID=A0A3P3YC11_PLABS|nr:unnamed protein product [Plasmodiophora brassicae]
MDTVMKGLVGALAAIAPVAARLQRSRCASTAVGFDRAEMDSEAKMEFKPYGLHIMVGSGAPSTWPSNWDTTDTGKAFVAAAKGVKSDVKVKVTACDAPVGHVFVFPASVRYEFQSNPTSTDATRILRVHASKEANEGTLLPKCSPVGPMIFVCSHAARDARCGACGPVLVNTFREEIASLRLAADVFACSHIGGHKYAGNAIIFAARDRQSRGDWFGYVKPDRGHGAAVWTAKTSKT